MLFTFLLLLHPAFSEHYKTHPNWDDFSQSLEFQPLSAEFDNDDNKETGNDDGKISSSSSPPFSDCGISDYEPPMANNENIKTDSLKANIIKPIHLHWNIASQNIELKFKP
jgi:hypothetical protein